MSFIREPNAEPIPGYRLIEPIGSGGFGEVWKCEAPGGLHKAIKFVFGNLSSLGDEAAPAEQEKKALDRVKEIRHPFVLSMDRIEAIEGELVIVMELADKSVHDYYIECQQAGLVGVPRDALLRYLRDAAEALDFMCEKYGLQHLDIKPRNLFLVSDRVKVADFGLVKHLERSSPSGLLGGVTPLYAAPETFGGKISDRSDQYSLAIVYQEMLTGQRPFTGKNARQLAQQHLSEEPELRSLPEAERPIVARALAKDPTRRFPSCLAFVRALYSVRPPAGSIAVPRGDGPSSASLRPKTMADTMEDIALEAAAGWDDDGSIDLGVVDPEPEPGSEEVSQLGLTVAQPTTGALRPTVVIGIGALGRRALLELRCRFLDRFGDLDKLPLLRFLYLDSDIDAIKQAQRGNPEVSFKPSETYHLPLQPIAHYRRRQLDQLTDWLPREKLYGLPRSLKTQGARSLGRLAFVDNYLRVVARIKKEIQGCAHPDSLYQSVNATGLALRDNTPRIYVITGATGGSSGFLPDLGFAIRRLLKQLRHPDANLTAFLFCGAPDDPATPASELSNLYATLTELNHFSDPTVTFAAQYGADGPRLVEEGAVFDALYLLTQETRAPESRRDTLAHFGSYLFHEMTTPLGIHLERQRMKTPPSFAGDAGTPFRSFGTHAVWFPRGLLLRLAARRAVARLLEDWCAQPEGSTDFVPEGSRYRSGYFDTLSSAALDIRGAPTEELDAALASLLADPALQPDAIKTRLEERAALSLDGQTPATALMQLLGNLEEQALQFFAQDDPGTWARPALQRVRDWLGSGLSQQGQLTLAQRKSKVSKAMEQSATELALEWEDRFLQAALSLTDLTGPRVAAGEMALERLQEACDDAARMQIERLREQAVRVGHAQEQVQAALENCIHGAGGFSWFGGKSRRLLRVFLDHLAAFAKQCLLEDAIAAVGQFYLALGGRLSDRLRDLSFCRQRLRHVREVLEAAGDPLAADDLLTGDGGAPTVEMSLSPTPLVTAETFWETLRASATTRVVLPGGEEELERAAGALLATINLEQWQQLDQALQDHVLAPRGGLARACLNITDVIRHLAHPLVDQAATTLGQYLPITDVAQVELAEVDPLGTGFMDVETTERLRFKERVQSCWKQAVPRFTRARDDSLRQPESALAPTYQTQQISTVLADDEVSYLLIPASDAGKAYGEAAHEVLENLRLVKVPGQADLMFCRERSRLQLGELGRIFGPCRAAFEDAVTSPLTSPFARFDVVDWIPLEP
jgi:serine/threonine protein kinase